MTLSTLPGTLSGLLESISETVERRFGGDLFWIKTEITDVKIYNDRRWCFMKLVEKRGGQIVAEAKATFWARGFPLLEKFKHITGSEISNGLELTLAVAVSFHQRYGLNLEVLDLDFAFALGQMELARRETLERLAKEHSQVIRLRDEQWFTRNNQMPLPILGRRIALLSAAGSDGRRDFIKELEDQPYGYFYHVTDFAVTVQGDSASATIIDALHQVALMDPLPEVVVLVRGGGSQTDLKPFDDYHLAVAIASFPVPILTGIGHDRNVSIADLMARSYKTPTKVARELVALREQADVQLQDLEARLKDTLENWSAEQLAELEEVTRQILDLALDRIKDENHHLELLESRARGLSPEHILNRGFAWITLDGTFISDPRKLKLGQPIETRLKNHIIVSRIEQIHGIEKE